MKINDIKLGFVGCGKMASAIIGGCLSTFKKENIFASEINTEARSTAKRNFGIEVYDNNIDTVKKADVIIFCVKPFVIKDVLKEVSQYITKDQLIISIAAGVKIDTIKEILGSVNVIRVMPNTPAMVKEGMSAICPDEGINKDYQEIAKTIMSSVGETVFTEEKYIDIITSLSGSGPAFYYKIINDMAKAANNMGLGYKTALKLSAQTAIGAGKMILQSPDTPEKLIENVTTKGGCTEVGNIILNESSIENILNETIVKTAKKAKELG